MERVQARRRINASENKESNTREPWLLAGKATVGKSTMRSVLGDLSNKNAPALNAAKSAVLKKPPSQTITSTSVHGALSPRKPAHLFSKPTAKKETVISKTTKTVATSKVTVLPSKVQVKTKVPSEDLKAVLLSKVQIKTEVPTQDLKVILPPAHQIKHKDIAKAINTGQVIKSSTSNINKGVYDVDLEDDPQMVSEYVNDIIKYLLEVEKKYPIKKLHLGGQISEKFRAVLVNWMAEVADTFKLLRETFHMSVMLMDRYMQMNCTVTKNSLQLVGTVAMFIAHKYEEMYAVDLEDFVYICDNAFTKRQFIQLERDMLNTLNFCLGRPTAIAFLRRYNKVANATDRQHGLGKFFIELALMEYEFCSVRPSLQAAAACCLARWLSEDDNTTTVAQGWNNLLVHYSGYQFDDIESTVQRYAAMVVRSEHAKLQTIRNLYAQSKNQFISRDESLRSDKLKKFAAKE